METGCSVCLPPSDLHIFSPTTPAIMPAVSTETEKQEDRRQAGKHKFLGEGRQFEACCVLCLHVFVCLDMCHETGQDFKKADMHTQNKTRGGRTGAGRHAGKPFFLPSIPFNNIYLYTHHTHTHTYTIYFPSLPPFDLPHFTYSLPHLTILYSSIQSPHCRTFTTTTTWHAIKDAATCLCLPATAFTAFPRSSPHSSPPRIPHSKNWGSAGTCFPTHCTACCTCCSLHTCALHTFITCNLKIHIHIIIIYIITYTYT